MIKFSKRKNGAFWFGRHWTIKDEPELVKLIAYVALGQARTAIDILTKLDVNPKKTTVSAKSAAIQLLSVSDPANPYHRDGWMFQVISWIASTIEDPETLKTTPHMIHAHKGLDAVHLRLDKAKAKIKEVVICEDKATENPRKTIRDEVWPEFKSIDDGARENLLVAESSTLLAIHGISNPEEVVEKVLWSRDRSFRVNITVGDSHKSEEQQKRLFKGYRASVSGRVKKRRADSIYTDDLRVWLDGIAKAAVLIVKKQKG